MIRSPLAAVLLSLPILLPACTSEPGRIEAPDAWSAVTRELRRMVTHEMATKGLPALSIVLVDEGGVVWARGFGQADPGRAVPATAATVYRVGSVSKLFTDITVMQHVERGELDLDAPVTRWLPDFDPAPGSGRSVTLRQLMAHRAGLVREPPVGNYFDDEEPTLRETVASLNGTGFVHAPGTRTKYSNAGIAVVGRVLEAVTGEPFAQQVARAVLQPCEMRDSAFEPTPRIRRKLARASMWTMDGREFEAPSFPLGMSPAGSLYASVLDLGRFLRVLIAGGVAPHGRILEKDTLERMLTPQAGPDGRPTRFGIGFHIGALDGKKLCGHDGAIYGFATSLAFLPGERMGVAVVTSMDVANAVTGRIARQALSMMLARKSGRDLPRARLSDPVPRPMADRIRGRYAKNGSAVTIEPGPRGLEIATGSTRATLRLLDGQLVVDDRHTFGTRVSMQEDGGLRLGGRTFAKVPSSRPPPPPERWRPLIGEYGWDHNVLYVHEREGVLTALVEWIEFAQLRELAPDRFAFPERRGLYQGEELHFERDARGTVTGALLGGILFPRRAVGTADGQTFKIKPLAPVSELRRVALASRPPHEKGKRTPDLVDVAGLGGDLRFDIRYATRNNFMGAAFYREPRAFLQRPAAEALLRAARTLRRHGFGLLIHDAYRPWHVTKMFWDATPEHQRMFVADPSKGSRHNRGCAVDLTLYELDSGKPVIMTGGYDEMTTRSYPHYPGGTSRQRWQRDLLRHTMEEAGFSVYRFEWWHFDYESWREYPILNLTFDRITAMGVGR